ncbi:MAG: polysaccharide lyase family 7 protein [Robiginitomaculum sp.]|nr:polysaccharide lyase family 7 protein [Robiginitomaculum sp.]
MINQYTVLTRIASAWLLGLISTSYAATAFAQNKGVMDRSLAPASKFDLSHWNITLPVDLNKDGKVDSISVKKIQKYSHPDFFYLDDQANMVFVAPNKGAKTKNTSNTRSELRYMLRGKNTKIKTHSGGNNFAVQARRDSNKFGSVGGKMEATLTVDHVAVNAANPDKKPTFGAYIRN